MSPLKKQRIEKNVRKFNRHPTGHRDQETFLLSYCKWQFLRRNEQYQKDYDTVCGIYGSTNFPVEVLQFFEKTWGINYPHDYQNSLPLDEVKKLSYQNNYASASIPNMLKNDPVECMTFEFGLGDPNKFADVHWLPEEELAQIDEINLRVNLLNHKTVLMEEFEKIVDKWQKRKRKYNKIKLSPVRVDDWEDYWKVYDMKKENPGMTFREIAEKLKGKESFERQNEDRIQKAYKKCLELINGGYRKISL